MAVLGYDEQISEPGSAVSVQVPDNSVNADGAY